MQVTTGEQQVGRALSLATTRLVGELDDVCWAIYQAIDEVQMRTVDLTLDVVTFQAFRPDWINGTVRAAIDQCADTARVLGSVQGVQRGYCELVNKLEVFNLVRRPQQYLGAMLATEANVPNLVERAYALPPFRRIWALEGLGHNHANWTRAQGVSMRLLTSGAAPDGALPMLHAGLGLSVADDMLHSLTPFDGDSTFRDAVAAFRDACAANARPGYAGCAYESLGLVARTLHLPLMSALDRAVAAAAPALRSYFWHGAGRALYFSPLQFIPGVSSPWVRVEAETHDEIARLNATAGLAWAVALVNMRHPEIVAALLPSIRRAVSDGDAVAAGIASAFAMALETDQTNPFVPRFCASASAAPPCRLWSAMVPSLDEVNRLRRSLKEGPGLERLFEYSRIKVESTSGDRA